jgi:hypothetical protein
VYSGSWYDNLMHGYGELLASTGEMYKGRFEYGKYIHEQSHFISVSLRQELEMLASEKLQRIEMKEKDIHGHLSDSLQSQQQYNKLGNNYTNINSNNNTNEDAFPSSSSSSMQTAQTARLANSTSANGSDANSSSNANSGEAGDDSNLVQFSPPLTGSCLCGNVTVEAKEAALNVFYCHCSQCRAFTGSPYAVNCCFKNSSVRVKISVSAVLTPFHSSEDVTRYKCNKCGCPVLYHHKAKRQSVIPLALFAHQKGTSFLDFLFVLFCF